MRDTGFYKVKYEGLWHVARWSSFDVCWWLTGNSEPLFDDDFGIIDETRLMMPDDIVNDKTDKE